MSVFTGTPADGHGHHQAAGILATEGYHAGLLRTALYSKGIEMPSLITSANRISDAREAQVFVGIATANRGDNEKIAAAFTKHGYPTVDLTHDELAAEHVRYMVGGKSALAAGELIYRLEFPERPGALMQFLTSMAPGWNISMFHYRNQGSDYSRVLVGLQVPKSERKAFKTFLDELGYAYKDETDNPAYRLFLG